MPFLPSVVEIQDNFLFNLDLCYVKPLLFWKLKVTVGSKMQTYWENLGMIRAFTICVFKPHIVIWAFFFFFFNKKRNHKENLKCIRNSWWRLCYSYDFTMGIGQHLHRYWHKNLINNTKDTILLSWEIYLHMRTFAKDYRQYKIIIKLVFNILKD